MDDTYSIEFNLLIEFLISKGICQLHFIDEPGDAEERIHLMQNIKKEDEDLIRHLAAEKIDEKNLWQDFKEYPSKKQSDKIRSTLKLYVFDKRSVEDDALSL